MQKPTIANIARLLNKTLRVRSIPDASRNGLQVASNVTKEIKTVGFAVDGCLSTFEKACKAGADLLIVHHGIRWRPQKDRDLERMRVEALKESGLALYAAHLPLDLHEEFGNNMGLCRLLGLERIRKFGRYHGIPIGYSGFLGAPADIRSLASLLDRSLNAESRIFPYGKKRVRTMGIVSGGGGGMLKEAWKRGLDCLLAGEIDLAVHNAAREYGINVIAAGHYATETVGVKSLMPYIASLFSVKTVFISDPKAL